MIDYEINKFGGLSIEVRKNLYVLSELQRILYENGEEELAKRFEESYRKIPWRVYR